MKGNLLKLIGLLGIASILISVIMMILALIGAVKLTDGCFLRYDLDDATGTKADKITNTIMLDATANYTIITKMRPDNTIETIYDPNHYGEWINTNLAVSPEQNIKFKIEGNISLCRAYVPKNNIQQISDIDDNNNKVAIPRVEETNVEPISLIFDAKNDEWRNIAELFNNDQVVISISSDHKKIADSSNNIASLTNVFKLINQGGEFKNIIETADCSAGQRQYSPLCGRYSIYFGQYVADCKWDDDYYNCHSHDYCPSGCFLGCFPPADTCLAAGKCCKEKRCDRCGAWNNILSTAPEPYQDEGLFTSPWYDDAGKLFTNFNLECSENSKIAPTGRCPDVSRDVKDKNYIQGDYQNQRYFWYSADDATGLLYRLDSHESPTNAKNLGTDYKFAKIAKSEEQKIYDPINNARLSNDKYQIIYNDILAGKAKIYLQYRFWSKYTDYSNNTGGYVLNIKQTKCRRTNGNSFDDIFANRGKVQYVVIPFDQNPNTSPENYTVNDITIDDSDGNAKITTNTNGYLWMKILNDKEDYKESFGRYKVQFFTSEKIGSFTLNILNPLFELLKGKIKNVSVMIFKNMTCYGREVSSCTNFFNYIKALLILYVMSYGAMFLLGMVKINQQDLVIRIVKIAIVSGLMNGSTFEFFNSYILDFVTKFSDTMIANMSGYSIFSSTNKITNPFMFLDSLMSKIFFSKTFIGQVLALISMGLSGLIYFVILFIAVIIVIITVLRAVAVYIMAFLAVSLLISIAPLFLTFMLFDFTKYLFDNWVRFTFKYMIEPVILMAGIIILTQLFTIYLDFATGYSVCWKCALPIKIPFPAIPGLPAIFSNLEIFCINWFVPWGMDPRSGMMGINMQYYIALIIIAYGMYGYVEFSAKMVYKLTSTGGPSATHIGHSMSSPMEQGALKRVGLDNDSRSTIKQEASARLESRNATLDRANKLQTASNNDSKKKLENDGSNEPNNSPSNK